MPFNGSGGFVSVGAPNFPAVDGTTILASQYNTQLNDIFNGLSNAVTRDGQSPATANLPMGGFNFTNLGDATAAGRALVYGQTSAAELGGILRLPGGSAAVPGFTFTGDTNTGVYSPGADQVAISTGGTGRFAVDASGNIGVGTLTPEARFHAYLSTSNSVQALFGDGLTGAAVDVINRVTAIPNTTRASIGWIDNTFVGGFASFTAGSLMLASRNTVNASIGFFAAGAERARLDDNGFGIGMPATYKLDVSGSAGNGVRYSGPTAQVLIGEMSSLGAVGTLSNHALLFLTNSSENMRLDASGRLALGTAPNAGWVAGRRPFQISNFVAIWEQSNGATNIGFGVYEGGTNTFNYLSTGDAPTLYSQISGNHIWYRAAAGSAGGAVSLSENGRFDEGGRLRINGAAGFGGVPLCVKVGANQQFGVLSATLGGTAMTTLSGFTDAGVSTNLLLTGSDLRFSGNGGSNQHMRITTAGQLIVDAIHNNASGAAGTTPMVASGTYTPTLTGVTNVASTSGPVGVWSRTGSIVTVSVAFNVTPTAGANTTTQVRVTLPIPSNLTAATDTMGAVNELGSITSSMGITADTINDAAVVVFTAANTAGHSLSATFQYEVK